VVLRSVWTWALVGLSTLASAALFFREPGSGGGGHVLGAHSEHMQLHLQGMWVAFTVAAAFIVYFVTRIQRALAAREADLETERRLASANEKLASLATLAAGAAHELSTPLSTIAVVARELECRATNTEADRDDVALIRSQVDRCRQILDRMSADAGQGPGEGFTRTTVAGLLTSAANDVAARPAVRLSLDGPEAPVTIPIDTVARLVRGLIRNAQDASAPDTEVLVRGTVANGELRVSVEDQGAGMTSDLLARVGEPFFTTKPLGKGLGLGLFLTRTIAERLGGAIVISSRPALGTVVSLSLPATPNAFATGAQVHDDRLAIP
jgi:two-component system sensor histidine kinase RegB